VTHTKMQEQTGLNCAKNNELRATKTCSKSSVVVALCLLPTDKWIWKKLLIFKWNRKWKVLWKLYPMECTLQNLNQKSLTKAGERATSTNDYRHVSVGVSVQQYSVQCKGYNLIQVTTMEASKTRGTKALVYCLINSSLYTGTVQGWWSTPQLVRRSVGV
jgi:hypothetical protein